MPDAGMSEGHSCKSCLKADNSQMVCCDVCDRWYHFRCAGVTASIENVDWRCSDCSTSSRSTTTGAEKQKAGAGVALPNQATEGKQGRQITVSHEEGAACALTPQEATHPSPTAATGQGGTSSRSSPGSKSARARRLRAEASLIEEEERILRQREALLDRRKKLLQQVETEDECSDLDEGLDTIAVQKWLNGTGHTLPTSGPPNKGEGIRHRDHGGISATPLRPNESPADSNMQNQITSLHQKFSTLEQRVQTHAGPAVGMTWLPKLVPERVPAPTESQPQLAGQTLSRPPDQRCLTKNQIAARNGVCKELPKFNGKPEEWPLFLATYQQTTELCGFSEGENLLRLRQALEGAARNAVRNLLLHASCVPQILDTLRMKFGRPELIIAVLLARIREIPAVKENRLEALVDLALEVQNICATMKASNMVCHLNNPELEQELVGKLPGLLAAFWGMHKLQLTSSNLESFGEWLFQFAQGANSILVPSVAPRTSTKRGYLNAHANNVGTGKRVACIVCHGECSSVGSCHQFRSADRAARWQLVRAHRLCRRCLKAHDKFNCQSTATCGIDGCSSIHHQLLHKHPHDVVSPPLANLMLNAHSSDADSILFRVLPVTLHGNNIKLQTYAFFDDGSSLTLMDAELQERLNLKGTSQPLCLKWTANTHRYEEDSQVLELGISGANAKRRFVLKDVRTVKGLELPLQTLDVKGLQARFSHLRGLPLSSYEDAIPKLLIGLNNSRLGLSLRSREGSDNEPVAEKTRLGWTLKGVLVKQPQPAAYHAFHSCDCDAAANAELLKAVEEYVCLDNVDIKCKSASLMSKDDQQAVEQLKATTKRIQGRFETGLLWRHADITLPDSLPTALRRAQCLQAKLKRYPELAEILSSKIAAYVTKGYAKPLPVESLLDKGCWYLPIFPVYNPHKPGKVRLVWDAAAKTKGISLNSMLLKGPDQLTCLVSVLRRFRQRAIAVSGDIEEMYHQVRIRSEDQNYQRFVWLEPGDSKPSVFVMSVMTFGATCSPSSAQYVKNLNANEFHSRYPRAVESIVKNHYVDDMLDSVDTVEEAIQLVSNVSFIHSKGGFHIRNWRSNSEEVLNALQVNAIDSERSLDTPQEVPVEKVLGLWWLTKEDCFTFRLAQHHKIGELLRGDHRPTKREVLSVVMSIFDPLGLLNFYVIYAKVIFQDVWRSGCGWDDSVPDEHYSSWQKWVHLLPRVEGLRIPRCYFQNLGHESELEMHVFVDASENAYAATCYLRHTRGDVVNCTLIGSKVKVAPVKMLSIPRLELQAAVIGARLAAGVLTSHTLPIRRQTFWTDSRTVLAWIRSDHRRYSQFVAFRVSEILELTDVSDWRWIPSAENVADDATKWQTVPDFSNQSRWFKGPQFLKLARSHWPNDTEGTQTTVEELRAKYVGHHDAAHQPQRFLSIHERFSRWCRLLRATATVLLSVRIWKLYRKGSRMCPQLVEQEDLKHAEILLWREAQFDAFADEIALLRKGKPVARTSSIYRLSPYLDDASLLRLCGRVNLPGQEDPVILPKSHNITRLIVSDYHIKYFHGSSETVVNEIRQTFWIPRLRTVVSTIRRECPVCRHRSAVPRPPKMGVLPASRVTPFTRPFTYVGVDYFGPILIAVRRSTEKRYGVLLTCLTTRAVHLEIAYSLSADSCILAIRSFMARRGVPHEFWSDNATNFKATHRELINAFNTMDKEKLVRTFTHSTMKWKFIPPASPHMGGAWERLVRSVKDILPRILQSQRPSEELLRGALMEIEAVINSRPLTYIPLDHCDAEALTPNHFLLGSSSGMKPLVEFVDGAAELRKGWRCAQQLADRFWRRWLREYLPVITRRTKWFENVKPIEEGDVVYIIDPNGPRNCWPRGRVISVRKGSDGQVRSAFVKTSTGIYERPATRLAVLSISASQDEVDPKDIPGGSVKKDTAAP